MRILKRTTLYCLLAWWVFCLYGPQATQADEPPREETVYYPVHGDTLAAVLREMTEKGPKPYWGFTHWNVRWSGACALSASVTLTLPEWQPSAWVSAHETTRIENKIAQLTAHEQGHVRLFQRGYSALQDLFHASHLSCPDKKKRGEEILAKMRLRDKTYDDQTNHGKNPANCCHEDP
ncbi:MAG: DUF922 domain-containing protein [Magnetococcales bacterium]|nr:DUF922 domain-containing protein [Magnetococcales bacterium]